MNSAEVKICIVTPLCTLPKYIIWGIAGKSLQTPFFLSVKTLSGRQGEKGTHYDLLCATKCARGVIYFTHPQEGEREGGREAERGGNATQTVKSVGLG